MPLWRRKKTPLGIRLIRASERLLIESWWVCLSLFLSFNIYQYLSYKQQQKIQKLETEIVSLDEAIIQEENRQSTLQQELASQEDYLYNELVLKKELGLVGPGEKKIIFKDPE